MNEQIQEVLALTNRWVKRLSREKFSMLFTLAQPMIFWLIFFGNLFQRAADIQLLQAPNYMSFLAAGVVVMTVLNNGLAGGIDLLFDKENGFLERLMSTPRNRPFGNYRHPPHRYAIWSRINSHFYGHGLYRQKSWRFLLCPRFSFPTYDFSELGVSAIGSHARLDASLGLF
jgi:hypothetical protein